jgi:hypothetical protein
MSLPDVGQASACIEAACLSEGGMGAFQTGDPGHYSIQPLEPGGDVFVAGKSGKRHVPRVAVYVVPSGKHHSGVEPMIAEGGFARRLRDALEPRLADLGDAVVARAPSARWHVEFPNSRVYDFDVLLVFTPMSDRTAEVVVVSVTLRRSPDVMWTIDAVDRESLALMEVKDLGAELQIKMATDPEVAASVVMDVLRRNERLIVKELTNAIW